MKKPARTPGAQTNAQPELFQTSPPTSPRLLNSFDPHWANVDPMDRLRSQLPRHMEPMLVEFLQTVLKDDMIKRAYLQPRLHANQLELLTPWKAAFKAAERARCSPLLFLGDPHIVFTAAFVAPVSRFVILLPTGEMEDGAQESGLAPKQSQLPRDPNVFRAQLLHDALRQLGRRNGAVADTLSAVLRLDRLPIDIDEQQVARLSGAVALAAPPLHDLWPVTPQERALAVKYLRPS